VDGNHLCRVDRFDVGRTYFAHYCSPAPLVLPDHIAHHPGSGGIFPRKAAHVSEYAVLAVLFYRAFVHTVFQSRRALSAGIVLLSCAAYATSDEFHQSFVPSRTASLRDVMIDVCGATLAVLLYWSIATRRVIPSRSHPNAHPA
jgi:Predicted integral membrane protein